MAFSMGSSRWLMLVMVCITQLNFCLKPDVNAQYAACGQNSAIFDSNFNSATQSFTLMITNSFLNSSVPTTAPRCLLPSLFIFKFVSLNIRFAVSYFSGFTVSHDLLAFGKYPILDQKYLVYSSKSVYSLVFLHSLYRLHIQHTLCYLLLLYLIAEEVPGHKQAQQLDRLVQYLQLV